MAASDAVMDRKWISRIALEAKCRGVIIECNTGCHWRYAHRLWIIRRLAEDAGRPGNSGYHGQRCAIPATSTGIWNGHGPDCFSLVSLWRSVSH
ncbi:MAG: hypothetical protein ACLSA6_12475 [Holdemania massiliensis]